VNAEDVIDRFIDAVGREAAIADHLERAREFDNAARNKCGNCYWWMKRECPSERNVKGRNVGPSMNGSPCSKFTESADVEHLRDLAKNHRMEAESIRNRPRALLAEIDKEAANGA